MSLFFKKNRQDEIMRDPFIRKLEAYSRLRGNINEVRNDRIITSAITFFRKSLKKNRYLIDLAKNNLPIKTLRDYGMYMVKLTVFECSINELERAHESNETTKTYYERGLIGSIIPDFERMENNYYELKKIMNI
jgi:hypothetical protein